MQKKQWLTCLAFLSCISFLVAGCGGGQTNSKLDQIQNSSAKNGTGTGSGNGAGSGSGTGGLSPIQFLDCSRLDPDKVYLLGFLSAYVEDTAALTDPEDPTKFCVGFPSFFANSIQASARQYRVSKSGKLIYRGMGIYKFTQDPLDTSTDRSHFLYPYLDQERLPNDELLFSADLGDELFLKQNTDGSDSVYSRSTAAGTGEVYLFKADTETVPYLQKPESLRLLDVMPDGSLLMGRFHSSDLILIDTNFNETPLTLPMEGLFDFVTSKQFVDSDTGNLSVWIAVEGEDRVSRRWKLDLTTKAIIDEGPFASIPSTWLMDNFNAKMNGTGDLFEIGDDPDQPQYRDHFVVKRPIQSSGKESVILHNESSYVGDFRWEFEAIPFVHIHTGGLVTGS